MTRTFRFLAGIALIAAPLAANAACPPGTFPDPNDPNICYNASTELNLDGDEIGGELLDQAGVTALQTALLLCTIWTQQFTTDFIAIQV